MNTILSLVVTLLQNIFCLLNILLLCQLMFGLNRFGKLRHYFLFAGLLAVLSTAVTLLFPEAEQLQFLFLCAYLILWTWALSKGRHIRAVLLLIPATLVYIQWSDVLLLLETIVGLNKYTITRFGTSQTPMDFFSDYLLFGLLLFWLIKASRKQAFVQVSAAEAVFLVFFSFISPALCYLFTKFESVLTDSVYSICWSMFVVLLNIAVFYAIIARDYSRHYKQLSNQYRQQFDTEYSYFKEYRKRNTAAARFRHDWNNHILLLGQMLESGDFEQAKDYFQKLTEQAPANRLQAFTGNEITDMILSAKLPLFEKHQIRLQCEGSLTPLSFMENMDICILFSNLTDNAIEANSRVDGERFLTIKTASEACHLLIEFSNPFCEEPLVKDGQLLSQKGDSAAHGIGTVNMFSVIEKYRGSYELSTENHLFSIRILFPLA